MSRPDATEDVWLGRGNVVEFVVVNDGTPVQSLSDFTRAVFCIGGVVADSDIVTSDVIWLTDVVADKELPDGTTFTGNVVRAKLGLTDIVAGTHKDSRLVLFSAEYPNGLIASDNITFKVYASCID